MSKREGMSFLSSLRTHLNFDGAPADLQENENNANSNLVSRLRPSHQCSVLTLALIYKICCYEKKDSDEREKLYKAFRDNLCKSNLLNSNIVSLCEQFAHPNQTGPLLTQFMQQMQHDLQDPSMSLIHSNLLLQPEKPMPTSSQYYTSRYVESFEERRVIAKGGFGVVCEAMHKVDRVVYAVKKIFFKYKNDKEFKKIIGEAESLAVLRHENIVNYNSAWLEQGKGVGHGNTSGSSETDSTGSDEKDSIDVLQSVGTSASENESISDASDFEMQSQQSVAFIPTRRRRHSSGPTCTAAIDSASIESDKTKREGDPPTVSAEKENIFPSSFPNLQKLTVVGVTLYIQMEYCECDLRSWLDQRNEKESSLNTMAKVSEAMNIFRQAMRGVEFIHSKSVVHRDLKPQNIFISKSTGVIKIGDFGLACLVEQTDDSSSAQSSCRNLSAVHGTPPYSAPEQRMGTKYGVEVDIYSMGIILFELLYPCVARSEFSRKVECILQGCFPEEITRMFPEAVAVIKKMIEVDPKKRPSAKEILFSDLFKKKNPRMKIDELMKKLRKLGRTLKTSEMTVAKLKNEQNEIIQDLRRRCKEQQEIIILRDAQISRLQEIIKLRDAEIIPS